MELGSSLQYEPDQQEVDWNDDTEDGDGSPLVGQTQPEEEIQERKLLIPYPPEADYERRNDLLHRRAY